jgi:hypothetical protein
MPPSSAHRPATPTAVSRTTSFSGHRERVRKREARRAEAEAAASRQAAADAELRDQLIAACQGNIIRGRALDDVSCIRAALEHVPIDVVLDAVRIATDQRLRPSNQPATSWREERLLKAIAVHFARFTIAPAMAKAWAAARTAPQKPGATPARRNHQPRNPH